MLYIFSMCYLIKINDERFLQKLKYNSVIFPNATSNEPVYVVSANKNYAKLPLKSQLIERIY